jgi:hypothetical protein
MSFQDFPETLDDSLLDDDFGKRRRVLEESE